MGIGQLPCGSGELLVAHDKAPGAAMVQRTRDHLLDGRNTDRFAVTLALDRHGLAVLFGDQVDAVVTDRRGESDLPARAAQAGGDVALKLHPLMPSIAVMPARGPSRR